MEVRPATTEKKRGGPVTDEVHRSVGNFRLRDNTDKKKRESIVVGGGGRGRHTTPLIISRLRHSGRREVCTKEVVYSEGIKGGEDEYFVHRVTEDEETVFPLPVCQRVGRIST